MKSFVSTGILALVVVVFGLYAYFVEYRGTEEKEQAKAEQSKIIKWNQEEIDQIELLPQQGTAVKLVKVNESWNLETPVKDLADFSQAESILISLMEAKFLSLVAEGENFKRSVFGFEPPKGVIRVKNKNGEELKVEVGTQKNFNGESYISLLGSQKVERSQSSWRES